MARKPTGPPGNERLAHPFKTHLVLTATDPAGCALDTAGNRLYQEQQAEKYSGETRSSAERRNGTITC